MRPILVKFGGSVFKNPQAKKRFLKELHDLRKNKPVVLVHGGGNDITQQLASWGIKTRFVNGLRYTDARTMEAVEMILSGKINKALVACLNQLGTKAVGISGKDGRLLEARRVKHLGYTGVPKKVNISLYNLIQALEDLVIDGFLFLKNLICSELIIDKI